MGSAAAYYLTKAGRRVLGLDRFQPPHHFGSSHGLTRIIREAYFEHPSYVLLVHRAYELWNELEQESRRHLLLQTGGLMLETRTDLLDWTPVTTNMPTTAPFTLVDPGAGNAPCRYYRVLTQ
jgi:glycine/D-amino acid oxidase-like deaminating enzyme